MDYCNINIDHLNSFYFNPNKKTITVNEGFILRVANELALMDTCKHVYALEVYGPHSQKVRIRQGRSIYTGWEVCINCGHLEMVNALVANPVELEDYD